MSKGWGFKINYNQAIREDEAAIAHLTNEAVMVAAQKLLPEAKLSYPDFGSWDVYYLITYKVDGMEARAAVFGLTLDDVRAMAYFQDERNDAVWEIVGDDLPGDYTRGEKIMARFGHYSFELYTEEQRKKALSKARAALSRHKRNQASNPHT